MTKKQKITLVSVFLAVLIIVAGIAGYLNVSKAKTGTKEFQVEVISDRDDFYKIKDCSSNTGYLGEFMRTFEDCGWEESQYGMFFTDFYGMEQDADNQYWWCITVNDKEISNGADLIPLQDGDKYTFTLMHGW